jgi:hypothetical protein
VETLLNFPLEPFCPVNGTFDSGFSVSIYLFNSRMNYEPSKEYNKAGHFFKLLKGNVAWKKKKLSESGIVGKD